MKIKIIFPLLLAVTSILSSCKKADEPTPSSTTTNPTANGGSYFPTTTNNIWNYHSDNGNYSATSTGNTQQHNNNSYHVLAETTASSTTPTYGYIYQDGNKYYTYSTVGTSTLELKLIDLDLPLGNTWVTNFASNIYTDVTYTFKVSGTGLKRTVNGIQYTDVISIQLNTTWQLSASAIALYSSYLSTAEIQQLQAQTAQNNYVQTTYYANNVGMIEQTSATTGLNVQLVTSTIH